MGASQAEQVEARVVKWSVPPLIDRYKEACQDMSTEFHDALCQTLQEFSVALDLSNKGLKGTNLAPLCKVLNRQTNLLELHLSGNFLTTECVQFLGSSLASLHNLYQLNLNCTGLLSEHLQLLAKNLSADASYKLTDLDIGDNHIGDQSFGSLVLLTRHFRLKKLNLSGNKFSKDLFTYSFNKNLTLTLDQIEEFDISDNNLNNDAIIKVLSGLPAANLKKLDVSRNSVSHGFLRELLTVWGELDDVKLQTLKLSRCYVHDSDLFDLLRMSNSLETLDLSYNNELTSISLRRLLQCEPLVNLDLYGCYNIFKYFTELSKYIDQPTNEQKGKTIKLSVDSHKNHEESEYLVNMWKELYGNRAVLKQNSRLLCLSVLK
ncbi:hypothetical protein BDFB_002661 [Asbolus verrucosus]|uniref:LRR 8 domain containing protein n=1 Tax=Asbolus verrucosus TaxID=1661398 RepID=A0A482WER3_ASBVE|nr:hypothetical protein BDFB_002661 [Asbolus verrucosus]